MCLQRMSTAQHEDALTCYVTTVDTAAAVSFSKLLLCPVPQHDIAQLPTYVSTTIESGTTIASDYSRLPVHLSAAAITAKKRKPAAHLPSEQYIVQGHTQPSPVTNQRVCYTCYTCLMHQRVAFIGEG